MKNINKYYKGQDLICIKPMAIDIEQYGIDCLENQIYRITNKDEDGFYVETENGSEVQLTIKELEEYFQVI